MATLVKDCFNKKVGFMIWLSYNFLVKLDCFLNVEIVLNLEFFVLFTFQ